MPKYLTRSSILPRVSDSYKTKTSVKIIERTRPVIYKKPVVYKKTYHNYKSYVYPTYHAPYYNSYVYPRYYGVNSFFSFNYGSFYFNSYIPYIIPYVAPYVYDSYYYNDYYDDYYEPYNCGVYNFGCSFNLDIVPSIHIEF